MKRAKVSELKAHLSERLAEVRKGATLIVCDRDTPIAKLIPISLDDNGSLIEEPRKPTRSLSRVLGIALKHPVDLLRLLAESREEK